MFLIAAAAVLVAPSLASGEGETTPLSCDGKPMAFHVHRAKALLEGVYSHGRWEDPTPMTDADRSAIQHHKFCLTRKSDRKRIAAKRDKLADAFAFYRTWRSSVPFTGAGKRWAIPYYIVACESGGDYTPDAGLTFGGAYGILVSTWADYGGPALSGASQANYAKPVHQDIIAHRIWLDVGPSAWACA